MIIRSLQNRIVETQYSYCAYVHTYSVATNNTFHSERTSKGSQSLNQRFPIRFKSYAYESVVLFACHSTRNYAEDYHKQWPAHIHIFIHIYLCLKHSIWNEKRNPFFSLVLTAWRRIIAWIGLWSELKASQSMQRKKVTENFLMGFRDFLGFLSHHCCTHTVVKEGVETEIELFGLWNQSDCKTLPTGEYSESSLRWKEEGNQASFAIEIQNNNGFYTVLCIFLQYMCVMRRRENKETAQRIYNVTEKFLSSNSITCMLGIVT